MKHYDYLIVGSGLFGATFAHLATQAGRKCLVIDSRSHLGGNVYCEEKEGIHVHTYGAHIFHTNDKKIWEFVNSLVPFQHYIHCPEANYKGERYNLPFNMNTFHQMWGVQTREEAIDIIERQTSTVKIALNGRAPRNLEEQALMLVGRDIYDKLIKGYTEKQWGRPCTELPAFIIRRLPLRFEYNNNYFDDQYQGIPVGGYNPLIERLLEGSDTRTNCDFFDYREELTSLTPSFIRDQLTGFITTVSDVWSIVRYNSRQRYFICQTIKALQWLIILIGKHLLPASSSISISSCQVRRLPTIQKQSSVESIPPNGK